MARSLRSAWSSALALGAAIAAALLAAATPGAPRVRQDPPPEGPATAPPAGRAAELDPPLRAPAPHPDGRTSELEGWRELACARCHAAIAAEWAGSRHALAWKNERYQEELADVTRPATCHGCHIPAPLAAQKPGVKPAARDLADAHLGIRCESCHQAPDSTPEAPVVLGPFGAPTSAHGSRRDPAFLPEGASSLCIGCHATTVGPVLGIAKDFVATQQAERGRSCVGCHLQPLERPIAEVPPGGTGDIGGPGAPEPPPPARAGRSHALQTPRDPSFLARAFDLAARREPGGAVLRVANAAGHRVPGLVGREIALEAELVGADGAVVASASRTLDAGATLAADDAFELALAGEGRALRVRGRHLAPGFEAPVVFLERELALGP